MSNPPNVPEKQERHFKYRPKPNHYQKQKNESFNPDFDPNIRKPKQKPPVPVISKQEVHYISIQPDNFMDGERIKFPDYSLNEIYNERYVVRMIKIHDQENFDLVPDPEYLANPIQVDLAAMKKIIKKNKNKIAQQQKVQISSEIQQETPPSIQKTNPKPKKNKKRDKKPIAPIETPENTQADVKENISQQVQPENINKKKKPFKPKKKNIENPVQDNTNEKPKEIHNNEEPNPNNPPKEGQNKRPYKPRKPRGGGGGKNNRQPNE